MKKLSSLLLLALFLFTGLSMKAQDPTYYRPGSRLSLSQISEGMNVFIYSMCYVNGSIRQDFSRFIANSSNNATTLKAKPGTFVTSNVDHIWQVASKTAYNSGDREAVQLVFKRKMGSEAGSNLWDISSSTNNADEADGRKMVVTQWKEEAIVGGTSKSGTDVWLEDAAGNIIAQSALSETDPVYLVSAVSGISINTNEGNYQSGNANGYPVAFYTVEEATTDLKGFHVSKAPAANATAWKDGTTWYKMAINSAGWSYLDTSASYCDENGNLKMTNTNATNNLNSYWAITGNDTDGYKFYNAAAGPSKVLGVTGGDDGARMTMVAEGTSGYTTSFDITVHTDGYWYIRKHGTDNNYINCRNGYVALRDLPDALGNSGSAFQILAVDLNKNASTIKTNLLSQIGMWKKVPAIWPGATEQYNSLNAVNLSETTMNTGLVSLANAANAASEAFVSAVNGVRFTASNRDNATAARVNAYMYLDGSGVKGRTTSTLTMDEVMTMKPNRDITFKIYNASLDKYVGTPGGSTTSGVALANAANFDLFTSNGFNDNVVIFCINGTATMHLLNALNVSNYSSTSDMASRWLLSTDVSRHELQTAINNATTFKTNLETLMNKLLAAKKINVKFGTLSVTLPAAITKAQNAFDDAGGTPATRTAAAAALNAALTKAKGAWLAELGTSQQFRLKSHTITTTVTTGEGESATTTTTNYYLTMAQDKDSGNEGNAILAAYNETDVNQIFTLVPGTGANAGKYILVSKSKQLTDLGAWNTDMAEAGTPYGFEDVDVANSLFRVRTTQGLLGPNDGVTGDNLTTGKNKFLYTNQKGTRDNLTWELEFIAPTPGALDKTSLQATYNAQTWYPKNSLNIVATNAPSVATYIAKRDEADKVLKGNTGSTVTQLVVNTAEAELKAAYEQMLNNFINEADPTQSYRLVYYHPTSYTAKDLYMTLNPDAVETHEVNVMQVKTRDVRTLQTIQFRNGVDANQFYIIEGINKKELTESTNGTPNNIWTWNPALAQSRAGKLYTLERITLDGVDELIVRIATGRKWLGPNSTSPTNGTYVYNDKEADNYWIIKPCVSPEIVNYLKTMIDRAKRYEGHIGTGIGEYTTKGNLPNDALVYNNNYYTEMITETGAFENNPPSNVGITAIINNIYNTQIFPITINQPTPGKLYRFKGKSTGKYMCAATANAQMSMVESLDNPGVIFQLKAGETIDGEPGYKFLSYNTGYYTTNTRENGALAAAANSIRIYESESGQKGFYTMKSNYSGDKYISDNGNVVDRNGSYAANNCDWTIEEVTYLPVPINTTVGFGTLYSPVALKGEDTYYAQDERLEFYYGKKQTFGDKDKLVLTKLTGDIPAETGFIVKYKGGVDEATGCVFMKIADSAPKLTEGTNQLTGTLETIAKPANGTVYTLQNLNNTLGLYKYTGANVKGGKAYYLLANGSAVPKGFVFDFEGQTTGVESIEVNADNQVIYDLSGRRVAKAGKGLYIINGKKVLVK